MSDLRNKMVEKNGIDVKRTLMSIGRHLNEDWMRKLVN